MRGVVSAGDEKSALAGAMILEAGGNAFDAVCASMLTAPLSEPMLTSLGGGGFMMVRKSGSSEPVLYDFFVDVPPKRVENPDFFPIYVDFGTTVQEFHIGAGSTAVPGMVAGIEKIHSDLGSMSMREIASPAMKFAKEGIRLSRMQSGFVRLLEPILLSTPESTKLYAPDGRLIDHERTIYNRDYGDFLDIFVDEGSDIFYRGEIARKIDEIYREAGGSLRYEDLSDYEVVVRKPASFQYEGRTIYTNPPPSSGGILISFTLEMLDGKYGLDTPDFWMDIVESMAVTSDFRKIHVDPNIHRENLVSILADEKLVSHYKTGKKSRLNLWGNTTHISVIDSDGNCASVTTTNGEGSGIVIPGCGIMMNNMLGEEDLNPHGFFSWPAGVRLPSMMAPTIAMRDGEPELILGSAGSNRIRSAIVEVCARYLGFAESISEAIEAPRLHFENDTLYLEPGMDSSFIESAKRRYEVNVFDEKSLFFGGVNAVTGDFDAGADGRRSGKTIFVR
jgi:gamma-glutamyltranspeptidase/glutathione hydrolase